MSRLIDIPRKQDVPIAEDNYDEYYDKKWYGKSLNQQTKDLCEMYFRQLIEVLKKDPNYFNYYDENRIKGELKTRFTFEAGETLSFIGEDGFHRFLKDKSPALPSFIFFNYLYGKFKYSLNKKLIEKINDPNSVLDQCSLYLSDCYYANGHILIILEIPYVPYEEKFDGSNKLIHVENNKYYDRDDKGKAIKVNDKTLANLQNWFNDLCLSIEKEDEIGKEVCSFENLRNRLAETKDDDVFLTFTFTSTGIKKAGLDLPTNVFKMAMRKNNKFCKRFNDPQSKFYNCTIFIDSEFPALWIRVRRK